MRNFNSPKFGNSLGNDSDDDDFDSGTEPEFIVEPYAIEEFPIMEEYEVDDDDDANEEDEESDYDPNEDIIIGTSSSSSDDSDSERDEPKQENGEDSTTRGAPEKRLVDDYDEEMEEDEVIKAIITEIKKPRSKPPDIKTEDFVTDLCFHPDQDLLAVGTTTGDLLVYSFTNDECTLKNTHEVHSKSIRDIEFNDDGTILISTARDRSIMVTDVETGKLKRFWDNAHEEPVYTMSIISEHTFATGDDDGVLKLWDLRQNEPIFKLKEVEDFISSIATNDQRKYLQMCSGDGYLTTISIPQRKMYVQSEPYEEELTCMGVFRNDSKLVVGSSKGNFYTFNWGQFGYHCDAFTGPKAGVNKMVPITERIAVVGGEDGFLRAMHMVPGRVLGIVGQHTLAVETIDINSTGELIASSSHDNDIRFWNIKFFEEFDDIKYNSKADRKAMKHNLPSSHHTDAKDFFSDLAGPSEEAS
ncbi:WD repeat-containing protein 55 homolog [Uranotaenia lowii]|uniref:WD repeat-containing protein 55 homolog n=1 Tax=Uranotaenia lowii TaxID=190385 RepID=UPI00247A8C73|nr:WD repeat-containing protein 55 homolog [Uranotaenia lowii]